MLKIDINSKGNLVVDATKNYGYNEAILMLLNTVLVITKQVIAKAPEVDKERVKATVYDALNLRFSGLLETLAPEYELNPGLTTEAIMKAENEILEAKVKEHEMSKVQK